MSHVSSVGSSPALGRLVVVALADRAVGGHAVDLAEPGHAGLDADGPIAELEMLVDRIEERSVSVPLAWA